jgi:hypothetical protein
MWNLLSRLLVTITNHVVAIPLTQRLGDPVGDLIPQSSAFAVGHAVFAVIHVIIGEVGHKRLVLEKTCLRVLYYPVRWVKVVDYLEGPLYDGIRFF